MPRLPYLAVKLRELLAAKEWSMYELGRRAGVTQTTISALVRHARDPSWDTVQRIALALGISTEELRDPALTLPLYEPGRPGAKPGTKRKPRPKGPPPQPDSGTEEPPPRKGEANPDI